MVNFARQYAHMLLPGALLTLQITLATIPLFTALGLALAVARLWDSAVVRRVVGAYIELIRGHRSWCKYSTFFMCSPFSGLR